MRIFVLPFATFAILAGGYTDEPSEADMQRAFEASLVQQVRNALDFVAETEGAEAAQKIRRAGGDRFTIRSFRKHECTNSLDKSYWCNFAVDIEVPNGKFERQMNGRFSPRPDGGLAFIET
jgi:hypothetical protein